MVNQTAPFDACYSIYKIYDTYIDKSLNLAGLMLNTLNTLVYIRLISSRQARGDMFKYLLFKSIIDAYYSLRNLIFIVYDTKTSGIQRFRNALYFYLIFIIYGGDIAQVMSILCEVGACFSRFRKVSQKFVRRTSFKRNVPSVKTRLEFVSNYKCVLVLMLVLSMFLYSYRLFERTMSVRWVATSVGPPSFNSSFFRLKNSSSNVISNSSSSIVLKPYYSLRYTGFGSSDNVILLDFLNSILMNFIATITILVLNILTLVKTRQCLNRKRALTTTTIISRRQSLVIPNGNGHGHHMDLTVRSRMKISKAEMNISLMVFTSGLIAVLGHGSVMIYRIPFMAYTGTPCLYSIANFTFSMSYIMNFFIYFIFHKNFRKCFCTFLGSFGKYVLESSSNTNTHVVPV